MNLRSKMTTIVWALVPGVALAIPPAQPAPETVTFLSNHAGTKATLSAEGIGAIFGAPLAEDTDENTTTREFVDAFLTAPGNVEILGVRGVTGDDLTHDNDLLISNDKFRVFTYNQTVSVEDDLPMHAGFIKIVVLTGATEKIVHIGSTLKHEPEDDLPNGTETAQDALDTVGASADYGHLTDFSTPEEVIYNPFVEDYHRVWRFRGWDDDETYLFFVDTDSGEIVDAVDILLLADPDIEGTVFGYGTPGTSADDEDIPASAPVIMMLPGAKVTVTGEDPVFANTDGTYEFPTVAGSPVDVGSVLEGEWVKVISHALSSSPDLTDTVFNVVPPASLVDLVFNAPGTGRQPSEDTSQVNAFVAVQSTHDWFSALQPNFARIDQQVVIKVNWPLAGFMLACNSGYSPAGPTIAAWVTTMEGDVCNNSAFSTVTTHEYGHFILDMFLGNFRDLGFHEGVADTVSSLKNDTSCMFEDWLGIDHPAYRADEPCIRRIDAVSVNADFSGFDAGTGPGQCGINGCEVQLFDSRCGSPHCRGLALAQSFWDLRTVIGDAATERIFADFLPITRGVLDHSVIAEVLVADDDDGDLSTPSTNRDEIITAFCAHGWEDPTADGSGVVVEWSGPPSPNDIPTEGTDYTVNYEIVPPAVTLISTEKGGEDVTEWQIGRVVDSEAADIGVITADWSGTAHDIVVRVGDPAFTPCRNLYTVDIPAQSATRWSSVSVELENELVARARAVPSSSGLGGLIEGSMFRGGTILAEGIGGGAGTPGDLVVSFDLTVVRLGSIIEGAKLEIGTSPGIALSGELHGTIQINDEVVGALSIEGSNESTGTIDLRTDLVAPIDIAGAMSGDILVQGDINAVISIGGAFTGNICADNLSPGDEMPQLHFEFGPGGTVCGWETFCASDADCDDDCACTRDTCATGWCDYSVIGSECEPCMPALARAPAIASKNRYLAFAPSSVGSVAIQVELVAGPGVLGEKAWVGAPDADGVSKLVSAPVERTWEEPVIYVHGCRIVPAATYGISSAINGVFSGALEIQTIDKPGIKFWGDTVGTLFTDPPNGVTNIGDVQAIIFGFQQAANAPHKSWLDLEPEFPNGLVNYNDVFRGLRAFVGDPYPFSDPSDCDPAPPPPPEPGGISFSLSADDDLIDPNEQVVIDVFTAPASDVAVYEMSLEVTGGDTGSLDVSAMVINQARTDYIFTGKTVTDSVDDVGGRLAATVSDGVGVTVTSANDYLGTFTLTASADASGVFEVKVRDIDRAFLSDSNVDVLGVNPGDSLFIGVDVACVNDGHCDDLNTCTDDTCVDNVCQFSDNCDDFDDCTTDTCNAGVCEFANVTAGTSCEDGLFCTEPDTCDNQGNCLAGPNDPCLPGELCIEFMDFCLPEGGGGQGT